MSELIYITGPAPCTIVGPSNVKGLYAFSPLLQDFSAEYSPTTGYTFNSKFESLSYWACQRLAWQCAAVGTSYRISYNQGKCTLEITDNRGNVTIDNWEINPGRTTKGSLQNPRNIADITNNGGTQAYMKIVADYAAGVGTNTTVALVNAAIATQLGSDGLTNCANAALAFVDRYSRGSTSYSVDQFSLRHTTNASNRGFYNVADTNVNYIYTYAELLSEITNWNYWVFPCPNEMIGALSVIFANLDPVNPGQVDTSYMQGALKGGSGRVTAANNRINIITEYAIDVWSTREFGTF